MPINAAFPHLQQVLGGWQLAAADLRLRLVSGDVRAQDRLVTLGEGIEITALPPALFKDLEVRADAGGVSFPGLSPEYHIFLRRADVYRIWPIAGDWMPLCAVSAHLQEVLGGGELAAEDLRLGLASGEVEAQDRWATPGEGIKLYAIPRVAFLGLEIAADARGVSFPALTPEHNIFLRRADVYRVWPIAGDVEKPRQAALPATRPRGLGPMAWLVAREVYALILEGGKGSKWISLDDLLKTIRERVGAKNKTVPSRRTLDTALAYLRNRDFIDR
jgi:hypothetical protein